jgi:phage baseplate assembly protein W
MAALFKGFSTVNRTRAPFSLVNEELVKQDLMNEFNTRKGERVMRPNFGSIVHSLLFDPEDPTTEETIKEDIARIVDKDPRVSLLQTTLYITDHTIRAEVGIRFLVLNSEDTLYLEFTKNSNQDST